MLPVSVELADPPTVDSSIILDTPGGVAQR